MWAKRRITITKRATNDNANINRFNLDPNRPTRPKTRAAVEFLITPVTLATRTNIETTITTISPSNTSRTIKMPP